MSAYFIADLNVGDPEATQIYRKRAAESIAQYGGRYLVRGGNVDVIEGNWTPERVVVVEFSDKEQARKWYRSPEYASALEVADRAFTFRNLILVEGYLAP